MNILTAATNQPVSNTPTINHFPDRIEPLYTFTPHQTHRSISYPATNKVLTKFSPPGFFSIMTCRVWFWLHFCVTIHHLITYMTYMTIRWPQTPKFNRNFLFTVKFDIFGVIYSYLISKRPLSYPGVDHRVGGHPWSETPYPFAYWQTMDLKT